MAGPQRRWPPYTDVCDKCPAAPRVVPLLVTPDPRGRSKGVAADYLCPAGHTWTTGWAWWGDDERLEPAA